MNIQDVFESCDIEDKGEAPQLINIVKISKHNSNPLVEDKGSLKLEKSYQHPKFYQENELLQPLSKPKHEMLEELQQGDKRRHQTQA